MRILWISVVLLLASHPASAQILVRADNMLLQEGALSAMPMMGVYPTTEQKQVDLKSGSPFFNEAWRKSLILAESGVVFKNVATRINLYSHQIHFLDDAGQERVAAQPLSEVLFEPEEDGRRVHFINGNLLPVPRAGWYQLLVNDKLILVKGFQRFLEAQTRYAGGKDYVMSGSEAFLVFSNKQPFVIKKISDFVSVKPQHKEAILQKAKQISNRLSREAQFTEMALFINTL